MRRLLSALTVAGLAAALLSAPSASAPASAAAPVERVAKRAAGIPGSFYTEDSHWCRLVRNTQGHTKYVKVGGKRQEWVPIGEIHTGPNTIGKFLTGTGVSTSLSGGLSINAGKSWSVGASFGQTTSYTVKITLKTLGKNKHKQVVSRYAYQKYQIYCGNKDPRSGVITWAKSPRMRYVPLGWSGRAKYKVPPPYTIVGCKKRGPEPTNKIFLAKGQWVDVNWSTGYEASATLSGLGLSAGFKSTTSENTGVAFQRKGKGKAWLCGNQSRIEDSNRFYANGF